MIPEEEDPQLPVTKKTHDQLMSSNLVSVPGNVM
jgi:hypothetical protein